MRSMTGLVSLLGFAAFATAVPALQGRQASSSSTSTSTSATITSAAAASTCTGNAADTRSQWCDYDLSTDWYTTVPDTGVTRTYTLELTQETAAPDGYSRMVMAVNGSIPGPTIFADWGDWVEVTVLNTLTESQNGTSIHFHGIRQNWTNQMDGVVSITQCPTAPDDSYVYKWRAEQYGTTWYHSHFALQAWEGVFGGIVINGPASSNYDTDLGVLFLNDWSHQTADELYTTAEVNGPPTLDNGLINGTNVYGDDDDTSQTGSRLSLNFTSGQSYRLRLINAAIDTHWKFSLDNHTMTVMATDLVPITPYSTSVLNLAMGQRYDIVITADQADVATDFWMRAIPQVACSDNDSVDNIKAIVHYGSSTTTPTTTGYSYTDECVDEDTSNLVPYLSKTVDSSAAYNPFETASVGRDSSNLFKWYLNDSSMSVEWDDPTLLQVYNNVSASSFTNTSNLISLPSADEWVYVIIQTTVPVPHPIHLHGHDFYIISQGTGTYSSSTTLTLSNPPRRDVALLPASGYLVLAFQTDNPGAWLMHCHIGWHTSEGFALQFLERESDISIDSSVLNSTCDAWSSYATTNGVASGDDSGI